MEIQKYKGLPNNKKDQHFQRFKNWLSDQFKKRTTQADLVADALAIQKIAEAKKSFHEAELVELEVKEKRKQLEENENNIVNNINENENQKLEDIDMKKEHLQDFLDALLDKIEASKALGLSIVIINKESESEI